MQRSVHTLILGAGAAGMMAAIHAGPDTLVIDHARKPGEKIRISGGGRCNFTNLYCEPNNFLGLNPHFHKSALARYTQWDFIALVDQYKIAWHEKSLGQLFCDEKATEIVAMLLAEMEKSGAQLWLEAEFQSTKHVGTHFITHIRKGDQTHEIKSQNLIIATGGKSIPKMGATGVAYDIARHFGHAVTDTRPALVPFTFDKDRFTSLAGVATPTKISNNRASFDEAMLFTHRGLSGPAILQISSYWRDGEAVSINLLPETDFAADLRSMRQTAGRKSVVSALGAALPARLVQFLAEETNLNGNVADLSDKRIDALCEDLRNWRLKPTGTEGYRTAEVTLGGIDTDGFDSQTMMSKRVSGLFAIGEAVDVTGWLGGFNFQWAWASGAAAGRAIAAARDP